MLNEPHLNGGIMKTIQLVTIISVLTLSTQVFAKDLMNCNLTETTTDSFSLKMELADDKSQDYVMFAIEENGVPSDLFTMKEKGSVENDIQEGSFASLVFAENVVNAGGILKNAGLLSISKSKDNAKIYSGFLSIKNNIYFLDCLAL